MNDFRDNAFNEPKNKRIAAIRALEDKADELSAGLSAVYAELGEKYYSEHKGFLTESGYQEFFDEIKRFHDKLSEIDDEIERLNSDSVCKNCGQELKEGAAFCPVCGFRAIRIEQAGVCVNCGKPLEEGALFCTVCGQPAKGTAPAVGEAAEDEPPANVCPQCGKQLRPGAGFCSGCGYRIN